MVELSIVIPSRDRESVLERTLHLLLERAVGLPAEVIVVYDGPGSGLRAAWRLASSNEVPLRVAEQPPRGPAAARNRGLALARAPACLLLGDDAWAEEGLVGRHLEFHRVHPEDGAALLGRMVPAPPLDRSPLIRWLHTGGVQFDYGALEPGEVDPTCFWTANVSAKTALLRQVGGFDESFTDAACEDAELGLRLARAGMRLRYDPAAIASHYHPTDLARTLERMRRVGRAFRVLEQLAPELEMPRRPGIRHRVKAGALTALATARLRGAGTREATWRFLCDEAQREAFWGIEPKPGRRLAIGDALARLAIGSEAGVALDGEVLGKEGT
jgi:glycosyltransferase involved in cell wall biosynthesis